MEDTCKQDSSQPVPVPAAVLTVRLSALYEFWPEAVRKDITQFKWTEASVALPMNRIESVIKTGRVVFKWGELLQWLDVSPATAAAPNGETPCELPLRVVVPLFMAQRPTPVVQKNIIVGENIPNLFAGMGKGNP